MDIAKRRQQLLEELEQDRERDHDIAEHYDALRNTIETADDESIRKMMTHQDMQDMLDKTIKDDLN